MLLVRCPKCGQTMKYQPAAFPKTKRCVYCGRSFKVSQRVVRKIS